MGEEDTQDLLIAFDILVEEVESEIECTNQRVMKATAARDYNTVRTLSERAEKIIAFRGKVDALRREWQTLSAPAPRKRASQKPPASRPAASRLPRGVRTPIQAYFLPILQVLEACGGSAQGGQVLERVGAAMKGVLKEVDYEPYASTPDAPRWDKTARFARHHMMKKGWIRGDSPRGVWEMTEAGRQELRRG